MRTMFIITFIPGEETTFGAIFVTSPSPVIPGLGPVFNNNSCQSCHANNGRGEPCVTLTSLLFRVSVPGESEAGGPNPVTGIIMSLRTQATIGAQNYSGVTIERPDTEWEYGGGTEHSLRARAYTADNHYFHAPEARRLRTMNRSGIEASWAATENMTIPMIVFP